MAEYIYLIRERLFSYSNQPVYKIGRTNKITARMEQYPKDSKVFIIEAVSDSVKAEKELSQYMKRIIREQQQKLEQHL